MTISNTIIYGTLEELKQQLRNNLNLNVVDEYGYTPLVQAVIVNDFSKAKLLLEAGAKVDFPDLTGRTALFWGADNGNEKICRLCLQYKANPNTVSSGGQSVLVMPIIKKLKKIKDLLLANGANLNFAQDFLNAKIMGHAFELEGRVDIFNPRGQFIELELEGFYLDFTVNYIASLVAEFINSFAARTLKGDFTYARQISESLYNGGNLLTKQHYLIDKEKCSEDLKRWLSQEFLVLPVAFEGHAISFIRYHQFFARIDRGAFGRKEGSAIIYQMKREGSIDFFRDLLYKRQNKRIINQKINEILALEQVKVVDLPLQQVGNCSWANIEGVIPIGMLLLGLEAEGLDNLESLWSRASTFYQKWQAWNRERSIDFCLQGLEQASLCRKMTKMALLVAVAFQSLKIDKHKKVINKLLPYFNQKLYQPILSAYVQTFFREFNNPLWQNFQQILNLAELEERELLVL